RRADRCPRPRAQGCGRCAARVRAPHQGLRDGGPGLRHQTEPRRLLVSLLRRDGAPHPRLLRGDERAHQWGRGPGGLLLPGTARLLRDLLPDRDAVLSLLVAAGAVTAVVAGIAGAWSPCGFSMVDTIGTALGDARRMVMISATATFTIGALAGGVVTFGGLSLLGELLGHGAPALAAAFADWRGWRIAPQIRRQVPERWRWIMPLPLACGLYGLLLGLGFTTFVLSFAVWALAGISFAADSAIFGVGVGVAFGVGRALPVLWIAPRLGTERGDLALERLALEPRLWLGLRRLDAIGLSACAAVLAGSSALAGASNFATDPSAYGGSLAWQKVGGNGWLVGHSETVELSGRVPGPGGG